MRLFIAEKPELARAIADAISTTSQERNNGYIKIENDYISWCFGHLLTLQDPHEYDIKYKKWILEDLPFNINQLKLKPIEGKENQIKIIEKLLNKADVVINAGDPDEEGQLLVDELLEYLGNSKSVKRILINDNTRGAVVKALNKLEDNTKFVGLKNSAYARQIADWKYGLNLTRAYTISANAGKILSVGRVQTPILNLVYERELEVKNHIKEETFNLKTDNNFSFIFPKDKLEDGLCKNKTYIQEIQQDCQTNNNFIISKIEVIEEKIAPPLPFNLLKLQQEAYIKYKYKPDKTQDITQILREKHKAITYNRSDCQYLSTEHYENREDLIKVIKENLADFRDYKLDSSIKSKAFNNENITAHHGIIPTLNNINVEELKEEELNIYKLIAQRYLLQFMPPQIIEKTNYIATNNTHSFKYSFNIVKSIGFKEVYKDVDNDETKVDNNETNETKSLHYKENDKLDIKDFKIITNFTKPKILYTQATLLNDLTSVAKYVKDSKIKQALINKDKDKRGENGSLGTPATRASIIKNLFDRGFLIESSGKIITTQLAKEFLSALPEIAKAPDITASWSEMQTEIKANKLSLSDFEKHINDFIAKQIADIKNSSLSISTNTNNPKKELNKKHKCPNCTTGYLQAKVGQYGKFWSCHNYKQCKTSYKDFKGSPKFVKGAK